MRPAFLALAWGAWLGTAQEAGLSKFTVANWNDISYGQAKVLSWTTGNGRPVSVQLDSDNGPYLFSFLAPENNNDSWPWTPDYSLSPGPHTLVLTQGPVADTSPPFTIQAFTPNSTTTNASSVSVLTPTGPAGVGSSTAVLTGTLTNSSSQSSTSQRSGGPTTSATVPTSTVHTTIQPSDTAVVNQTVFSTSYETNAAGSTTAVSSSPITTQVNITSSATTPSGTAGTTASASLQTAIAARSSLIGIEGGLFGSGLGALMTMAAGFVFAWLLL
ncbi:MAG: hypothetical protein M1821_000015 [Bathelium mastoideum]|nr:MAG: hypothetical protein M1821_000015 [Bathelium mastoideum]